MSDRDLWTVDAMEQYGGSFIQALAQLARHADSDNLSKLKAAWPEYWERYEREGKRLEKGSK